MAEKEEILTGGKIDVGDVSKKADLANFVSDLACAERHLYRVVAKVEGKKKKEKYMEIAQTVRELRGKKLKKLVENKDPEIWCLSKHLISAFQEAEETGIKEYTTGNSNSAIEDFEDSWEILKLFFAIQKLGGEEAETSSS